MIKSSLENKIEIILKAIKERRCFTLNEDRLSFDGPFKTFIKRVFCSKKRQILHYAKALKKALENIEALPIYKGGRGEEETRKIYALYTECLEPILEELKSFSSCHARKLFFSLKRDYIALKARFSDITHEKSRVVSLSLVNKLKVLVSEWKKNEKSLDTENVDAEDFFQIQTTSLYPDLVELFIENREIFQEWATFCFRDRVKAEIFILYPHLAHKLFECNLSGRIGRMSGDIRIVWQKFEEGSFKKVVTLPFEGKEINILDEDQQVELSSHYVITVKEAFQIFKNKNYEVGNLEYLSHGVTNWNVHKWGRFNPLTQSHEQINLYHQSWWWLLPTFEVVSHKELESRYGISLKKNMWCVSAAATSLTKTLDYENTHAFLEVAIPLGNGNYHILDFGKFATVFPSSFFESLSMFCHNLHATIAFPDENIYYLHRAKAYHSFAITEAQGRELMNHIRKDMVKGLEMNLVYQIESDNCAKWVHETLILILGQDRVPEMFKIHLLETEPTSFVSYIFKGIKLLPTEWQTDVVTFFHLPMGASKATWIYERGKRVSKSLTNHEFWETGIVFLPALLVKLKSMGMLELFSKAVRHVKEHAFFELPLPFLVWCFKKKVRKVALIFRSKEMLLKLILSRRRNLIYLRA